MIAMKDIIINYIFKLILYFSTNFLIIISVKLLLSFFKIVKFKNIITKIKVNIICNNGINTVLKINLFSII